VHTSPLHTYVKLIRNHTLPCNSNDSLHYFEYTVARLFTNTHHVN
jgi:hypothetical protein